MSLTKYLCMEKLLAREVTIFPEKIKSFNILLKCIKPTPNSKKSLPVVQMFEKSRHICQNPKLMMIGLSSLPMQNPYSKTFLDVKFLFANDFQTFVAPFRTKGILNNDKIFV